MMDYRYIEQLLQRYFDCDTTPQEETILRAFFSQEVLPSQLEPYRSLFMAEAAFANERLSDGFAARLTQNMSSVTVRAHRLPLMRRMSPLYKAVAGVAIVLCLGMAAQRGLTTGDDTVTPRAVRVAGEQLGALPQDAQPVTPSVTSVDTLVVPLPQ